MYLTVKLVTTGVFIGTVSLADDALPTGLTQNLESILRAMRFPRMASLNEVKLIP